MDKASKKNPTAKEEEYEDEEEEIEDDDNQEEDMENMDEDEEEEEIDDDEINLDEMEGSFPVEPVDNKLIETETNPNHIQKNLENLTKKKSPTKEESVFEQAGMKSHSEAEVNDNLLKLINVDLQSTTKKDVVDLLMKTELMHLHKPSSNTENKKRKIKQKYNVESHYNLEKLQTENQTHKNLKATMMENKESPELTNDFNTAIKKLKNKLLQEPESKDQKIYKILFNDKEKNQADVERLSSVKTDYIANKVKGYLLQKQKKIENITDEMNEEMKQKCTFNPEIMANNPEYDQKDKRSLEQFLQDQNKHVEKVIRKVEESQKKKEKEEQQIKDGARPKIDPNSQKIFEEKIKTEDKPFERLYKQRFGTAKNDIVENSAKKSINKSFNENKKNVDKIEEFLIQKEKDKKPISKKEAEEHVKKLYQSAYNKQEKLEKLKIKVIKEETKGIGQVSACYESNKFVLKNVMKKYKEIINGIFANLIKSTGRNTIDYSTNQNDVDDPILNQIQLNRISLIQLSSLLQQLGFVSEISQAGDEKNRNSNNNNTDTQQTQLESLHKLEEKKLTCDMWEALKDSDGYVNVDHLFIFILAVINLYEYYLYSSYKITNKEIKPAAEVVVKNKSDITEKEEILKKISNDINAKISSNGKYSAHDEDKNFLITFEKSKLIQKDFNNFYINFMNSNSIVKKKSAHKRNLTEADAGFKPNINRNSERLSVEYRNKLVKELDNSLNATSTGKQRIQSHTDYLNKLILKKKKNESIYAKAKEENLKMELTECTFKPKIIDDYPIKNDQLIPIDTQGKKMRVWEKLYKIGVHIISNKKDVDKDDLDVIQNGKECSFRPNIDKPIIPDEVKDNIYGESYEVLYNRLKNGRTERKVKESVHEKWEFPDEYYEYLNKNKTKSKNYYPKLNEVNLNKNIVENNIAEKISLKERESPLNSERDALATSEFNSEAVSPSLRPNSSFEEEKKDAIPLLIIDVNIRPGVKKKIYVFDGDTSDALAEKFSKEHNLDAETKSKLQILIQSHMSRLLMRIDEENQSISEKSSAYNLS